MNKLKDELKIIFPIWVIAGIFGYIYEVIFYLFDKGYFINRGSTFGPWIPIYGFGAIFIYLFTKKIKDKKILLFLASSIICGILEFTTAYLLYHVAHTRLWDYNIEILNFGNIGGYICLRSILLWGFCGILLVYGIIPLIKKLYKKYGNKLYILSIVLSLLFLIDFLINVIV
jgi:uncharacterized membrane protein